MAAESQRFVAQVRNFEPEIFITIMLHVPSQSSLELFLAPELTLRKVSAKTPARAKTTEQKDFVTTSGHCKCLE